MADGCSSLGRSCPWSPVGSRRGLCAKWLRRSGEVALVQPVYRLTIRPLAFATPARHEAGPAGFRVACGRVTSPRTWIGVPPLSGRDSWPRDQVSTKLLRCLRDRPTRTRILRRASGAARRPAVGAGPRPVEHPDHHRRDRRPEGAVRPSPWAPCGPVCREASAPAAAARSHRRGPRVTPRVELGFDFAAAAGRLTTPNRKPLGRTGRRDDLERRSSCPLSQDRHPSAGPGSEERRAGSGAR